MRRFIHLTAFLGSLCAASLGFSQSTLTLPVDYRDFLYIGTSLGTYGGYQGIGHPDFNSYGSGVVTGLVQSTLGTNGLPVFNDYKGTAITSAASFAQWYQNTAGVNVYVPGSLVLANIGNNTYRYSSTDFFPLDGVGFNSDGSQGNFACDGSGPHNFSFTTHIAFTGKFVTGSESISFTGDDDVWIFVNGKLVVDLGGVHGATIGTFTGNVPSLVTIGASLGQTLTVHIFQAERHTCGSDFTLTTSMVGIVPVPPNIAVANSDSQVVVTFDGILQQSSDLVHWQDVTPQPSSPWTFSPTTNSFFQARR